MANNPLVRFENLPEVQGRGRGYPSIGPLYMNTTTPRDGEPYTGDNLAGARDVFGALSQSSQFKISLHLVNGSAGDENLNQWLQASGLTNDPVNNEYYNFYCDVDEIYKFEIFINNFFNQKVNFPKIQTGSTKEDIILTKKQIKQLEEIYEEDFRLVSSLKNN